MMTEMCALASMADMQNSIRSLSPSNMRSSTPWRAHPFRCLWPGIVLFLALFFTGYADADNANRDLYHPQNGTSPASQQKPRSSAGGNVGNTGAIMDLNNKLQAMERQQRDERARRERADTERQLEKLRENAGPAALTSADVSCAQQVADASNKSLMDLLDAPNGGKGGPGADLKLPPCKDAAAPTQPVVNRPAAKEGNCRMDLQYLSSKLPVFTDSSVAQIRNQVVQTDVRETINVAKAQGFNASTAYDASWKQAQENDRAARQGAKCAADVSSWGESDESFYQAIASGRINRAINCRSSMMNACLCAGIINKMAASGSRAVAASMQCLAKNGQW